MRVVCVFTLLVLHVSFNVVTLRNLHGVANSWHFQRLSRTLHGLLKLHAIRMELVRSSQPSSIVALRLFRNLQKPSRFENRSTSQTTLLVANRPGCCLQFFHLTLDRVRPPGGTSFNSDNWVKFCLRPRKHPVTINAPIVVRATLQQRNRCRISSPLIKKLQWN